MFKTIIFALKIVLSLLIAPFYLIGIKRLEKQGKLEERTLLIHQITHRWANFVMKANGANVKVVGLENIPKDTAVLFVSNHQGNFDIPLLMSAIDVPKGFIAKKELEKIPGISMWMRYIRCIFMDRDNLRKSAQSIIEGVKTLKSGYSMVIFPEGTRSKGSEALEFKAGSFKLATKSKVPIVPITIDGSYKLLEINKKTRITADNVKITVHPAIDVTKLSKEEISTLHETVRKIIVDAIS